MTVPYRGVALAAGLLAATCLSALVIVASVHGADALATTALSLAIITFVVQLIVYVAQAEQARRENELAQRLHGELRASLADISARAHGTESTVEKISDKLLDRALRETGSSKLEDLPPGFTRDVAKNLAELMDGSSDAPSRESSAEPDVKSEFPEKKWGPEEDERVRQMLLQWPSDETEINEIRDSLDGLSEFAISQLSRFAEDEKTYRAPDSTLAPSLPSPNGVSSARLLFERGLLEDYGKEAYGSKLAHLTEKGRRVARAFTADGRPPEQIQDLVEDARAQAAKWEADHEERHDDDDSDS